MEKRYLSDSEYASMIELSELYLDIIEEQKDRYNGRSSTFLNGLRDQVNAKIKEREGYLSRMEEIARIAAQQIERGEFVLV